MCGRETVDPGAGARAGLSEAAERTHADGTQPRLSAARTTTLFAAFEVATGKVTGAHKKRRRRKEFLAFMDEVATYPKTRLEVILDNLNTHKNEEWLARHPLVTFHYTPTRASWLNQVEGWFSILQGQSLTGASFTSDNGPWPPSRATSSRWSKGTGPAT